MNISIHLIVYSKNSLDINIYCHDLELIMKLDEIEKDNPLS